MDCEVLPTQPRVLNNGGFAHVDDLLDDVQLAKPVRPPLLRHGFQKRCVLLAHVLDVAQPVVDQPQAPSVQRGDHPAAPVVAHHQDVADLENVDRKLHDAQAV